MIPETDLQKLIDNNFRCHYFDKTTKRFIIGWNAGSQHNFDFYVSKRKDKYILSINSEIILDNIDQVIKYLLLYNSVFK